MTPALDLIDADHIIGLRRQLHQIPELAFDLPQTLALVRRELAQLGIAYTERFGTSSIVATINPDITRYTIGIRADMDALKLQEKTGAPYQSRIPGHMHACGHDAHTAMLLGTARALQAMRDQLTCRVKLLFQPSEEGYSSGAERMVADGVMDDIDIIIGQHIDMTQESGHVGVCPAYAMPASRTLLLDLTGNPTHATTPHKGVDALAMAFRIYGAVQLMLARETDPLSRYICSFNKMQAGTAQNIVAGEAQLVGTIRSFEAAVDTFLLDRISQIAQNTAAELGGQARLQTNLKCLPLYNDRLLSASWIESARKVVGPDRLVDIPLRMGSEDFSYYLTRKPGVFFRLGVRNAAKGITVGVHNSAFDLDEAALATGSAVCVQFVLDHMAGHARTEAIQSLGYRMNQPGEEWDT